MKDAVLWTIAHFCRRTLSAWHSGPSSDGRYFQKSCIPSVWGKERKKAVGAYMDRKAKLIITHSSPDLDAMGFMYSAWKVFGRSIPVEFRQPSREELEDPEVIVGDVGRPGCEAIGHSPELNNFDHHYSNATRSATFLFNEVYHSMRGDLVEYIDRVDTRPCPEDSESTLKVAAAGIRVCHREGKDKDQMVLEAGGALLAWIEETGQTPGDLNGPFPFQVQIHLAEGREELRKIRNEVRSMQEDYTSAGRRLGYVVTRSPVFSLVKEEMFAVGVETAVVYEPTERRFSVACDLSRARGLNLKGGGLVSSLNELEHQKGLPKDLGWGGHEDRIGSPKQAGSLLAAEEVLGVVRANL